MLTDVVSISVNERHADALIQEIFDVCDEGAIYKVSGLLESKVDLVIGPAIGALAISLYRHVPRTYVV